MYTTSTMKTIPSPTLSGDIRHQSTCGEHSKQALENSSSSLNFPLPHNDQPFFNNTGRTIGRQSSYKDSLVSHIIPHLAFIDWEQGENNELILNRKFNPSLISSS